MKTMRKTILAIISLLVCAGAFAQDYKSVYQKYSDHDNVTAVYVSPAMFRLIGKVPDVRINDGDVNLGPMIKSMTGFYMLQTEDQNLAEKISKDLGKVVTGKNMELLMEVKEKGQKVKIFSVGDNEFINSLVLNVTEAEQRIFISIDGLIKRRDLEEAIGQSAGQLF